MWTTKDHKAGLEEAKKKERYWLDLASRHQEKCGKCASSTWPCDTYEGHMQKAEKWTRERWAAQSRLNRAKKPSPPPEEHAEETVWNNAPPPATLMSDGEDTDREWGTTDAPAGG
jgi:hypothetical protein